jgi:hypothetical protein
VRWGARGIWKTMSSAAENHSWNHSLQPHFHAFNAGGPSLSSLPKASPAYAQRCTTHSPDASRPSHQTLLKGSVGANAAGIGFPARTHQLQSGKSCWHPLRRAPSQDRRSTHDTALCGRGKGHAIRPARWTSSQHATAASLVSSTVAPAQLDS